RAEERRRLNVADDETAVLFVGRLSHHAKAHPFPMFRGVAHAAQSTGTKAHLLLVGWAATAEVQRAFESAAQLFAPRVRVSFVDGRKREYRFGAWRAADVFMSLSDNIQETFGLVIVEAMASGLPVVATDWNGYRDLVTDGETGFLIPTLMLPGATADVTSRLLVEEINYDHFLARCSQAVAVDCAATSQALVRLFEDAGLRQRMGAAGRRRAVEQFAWPRIIQRYEALWRQQDAERRACAERSVSSPRMAGPAAYPPPERSFAGYPTRWLDEEQSLQTAPDAAAQLNLLLSAPLTNHEASSRGSDPAVLQQLLHHAAGSCSLAELDAQLRGGGLTPQAARATLAWMMKYDLLRPGET
ncbi:MAG: glycosyltransferase family 4 protein, partial [Planctomycetaceae bacterium]